MTTQERFAVYCLAQGAEGISKVLMGSEFQDILGKTIRGTSVREILMELRKRYIPGPCDGNREYRQRITEIITLIGMGKTQTKPPAIAHRPLVSLQSLSYSPQCYSFGCFNFDGVHTYT